MMKRKNSLFSPLNFVVFFFMVAFTVTCCFMIFLHGVELPEEVIKERALFTLVNVIVISALFTAIDLLRRIYFIKRPIKKILDGTKKIRRGDFDVRIQQQGLTEFDVIIDDINSMAEELAGIETLRSDFIANVSHELKTPLAVIQSYASMLQNEDLTNEERSEYVKTLIAASRRLSNLITNILKLSKLENQQIFPDIQSFDLSEQLAECLFGFESAIEEKNLQIEADIIPGVYIRSDAELLTLVWNNIISNAVKFTDNGGRISISLSTENGAAVVSVADTGCGISRETGRHIFEKFYQGDTSRVTEGNGLGLALVKRVVDIVRGEIELTSELGVGSTFTVRIPER